MAEHHVPLTDEAGGKPLILKIPAELLCHIVDLAITAPQPHEKGGEVSYYQSVLPLTLVCRQFHLAAVPHLYSSIDVSTSVSQRSRSSLEQLHDALEGNPKLGSYCRSFRMTAESMPGMYRRNAALVMRSMIGEAIEIVSWLPNVQRFSAHGGFEGLAAGCPLVQTAVENMIHLERMLLSGGCWRASLTAEAVEAIGKASALRELDVEWPGDGPNATLLVDGSAPFTSLTIHDDNENWTDPAPLLQLMQWPKTIKHLQYFGSATHGSNPLWDAKFSLGRHTATVETLAIYPFQYKALSSLGLNSFQSLEKLTLVAWELEKWMPSTEEASKLLLAPRLRSLRTLFPSADEDHRRNPNLYPGWLRAFAATAAAQQSSLKLVDLFYVLPSTHLGKFRVTLDKLAAKIRPSGIEFRYTLRGPSDVIDCDVW